MTSSRSRNSGPKRRVRQYAAQHNISYQKAQQILRDQRVVNIGDADYGVAIGTPTTITPAQRGATYGLADQEVVWTPFASASAACMFIENQVPSMVATICHQLAEHPTRPADSFLFVTPIPTPEDYPDFRWLASAPADISHYVMANEHTGYAAAGAAADAIAAFQPKPDRVGVVVLDLQDPYPQVTDESNRREFEEHWKGTRWERHWEPSPPTDGPFWEEYRVDHPEGSPLHLLTAAEQQEYARFLGEVDRLLRRAAADHIVVLLDVADNHRAHEVLTTRYSVDRFGGRLSGSLRLEYRNTPSLSRPDTEALTAMFPDADLEFAAPQGYFWKGMNPKEGRVVLAQLPGLPTSLLLLRDPPEVPDYWAPSYRDLIHRGNRIRNNPEYR